MRAIGRIGTIGVMDLMSLNSGIVRATVHSCGRLRIEHNGMFQHVPNEIIANSMSTTVGKQGKLGV